MADESLCGKCGKAPKRKNDAWCAECRNSYQRERRDSEEGRHFARGAEAMRAALVKELMRAHPDGMTTFGNVTDWIRRVEVPQP